MGPSHSTESLVVYILPEDREISASHCYNRVYFQAARLGIPSNQGLQYSQSMTASTAPVDHKKAAPAALSLDHHKSVASHWSLLLHYHPRSLTTWPDQAVPRVICRRQSYLPCTTSVSKEKGGGWNKSDYINQPE